MYALQYFALIQHDVKFCARQSIYVLQLNAVYVTYSYNVFRPIAFLVHVQFVDHANILIITNY